VWPEVLSKITECSIENYSIFFKDNMLFSYFEYYGVNAEDDWTEMAAGPKSQEWWAVMMPMQGTTRLARGRGVVGHHGGSLSS
jgi:L-rhamnose mutarotase